MALRVLLADESSTIKKVFQLALQDYAVEVKSVNVGIDVLPVAQKYQPDVIFADVLLQKQSGYEVCAEIKKDNQLGPTPVVLMWSGFMELDQDKFDASGAEGKLEKPFDVKALRHLVQSLVPKTKSQDISQFLQFPKMPEFVEDKKAPPVAQKPSGKPAPVASPSSPVAAIKKNLPPTFIPPPVPEGTDSKWSMEDFAAVPEVPTTYDPAIDTAEPTASQESDFRLSESENSEGLIINEDFEHLSLTSASRPHNLESDELSSDQDLLNDSPEDQTNSWAQENLSRFQIQVPDDPESADIPEVTYSKSEDFIDPDKSVIRTSTELKLSALSSSSESIPSLAAPTSQREDEGDFELELEEDVEIPALDGDDEMISLRRIDPSRVEEIIKTQVEIFMRDKASQLLEEVIWKIVPEMAEKMIERELKRLLEDFEPQQYR